MISPLSSSTVSPSSCYVYVCTLYKNKIIFLFNVYGPSEEASVDGKAKGERELHVR